jgi:hypothetical protein
VLSTVAVSATTDFVAANGPGAPVVRQAAVEGYVTAFWWAAGLFAIGALVCGGRLRSDARPEMAHVPEPEPAATQA